MVFAALLSLRKRFRIWRIGSARAWMKAHLWLGFLALPMVLFHAAFHARGLLAFILMSLTIIVVFSGIYGAYLQHTLPTRMFREVPYETIYDQIHVIRDQLVGEARQHATNVTQVLAPARGAGATVTMTLVDVPEYGTEVARLRHVLRLQGRALPEGRAQAGSRHVALPPLRGHAGLRRLSQAVPFHRLATHNGARRHLQRKTSARPSNPSPPLAAWVAAYPSALIRRSYPAWLHPRICRFTILGTSASLNLRSRHRKKEVSWQSVAELPNCSPRGTTSTISRRVRLSVSGSGVLRW